MTPLALTPTPPDRAGWYWMRLGDGHPLEVVEVYEFREPNPRKRLTCRFTGHLLVGRVGDGDVNIRADAPGLLWAGPIPEPEAPR